MIRITGVALLAHDGRLLALPRPCRHFHLYALAALMQIDVDDAEQGFTCDEGRFHDRKVALRLVQASGQPNRRSGNSDSVELFSEDVW